MVSMSDVISLQIEMLLAVSLPNKFILTLKVAVRSNQKCLKENQVIYSKFFIIGTNAQSGHKPLLFTWLKNWSK